MKHIFHDIAAALARDEDFVLTTIIRHAGSSPRSTGARMLVRRDGSIGGTIGGGLLEAQVIQEARQVFETRCSTVRSYQFNAQKAADLGMICGGQVEVLLQYIPLPDEPLAQLYQRLAGALEAGHKAWLVTRLVPVPGQPEETVQPLQSMLEYGPAGLVGTGLLDVELASIGEAVAPLAGKDPRWIRVGEADYLVEPVHSQGTVYIFGAGHVSQMLAPLAAWVGFHTVVLDDRPEFANRERFAAADEVIAVEKLERAFEGLGIGPDSYIIIVTRGHRDDLTVLRLALQTQARYIGMIGSKRKRELVYQVLRSEGVSSDDLGRVHSPIGVEIGAETPEEIAISILAELIKVRAG